MSPIAEIICVGTELLLGSTLNTNAHYLAQQLAHLGISHYYQTVVGDNPERLKQVLDSACARSQLLIFTGGLGPTPDDLTTETLADFFHTPLEERTEVIDLIRQRYALRGRIMSPSNRKQALLPKGSHLLPNPTGTAPGMIWEPRPGLVLLTFPGVPTEMHRMWQETAIPYLKGRGWGQQVIHSRLLRYWGIAEAALAEKVHPFFQLNNPTVAPYVSYGEVHLRIAARASSVAEAQALIKPVEEKLRHITGDDCFGADQDSLASVVGDLLLNQEASLAVAESCTGGGLGQLLTGVPGSSRYFTGGAIAYDNRVKVSLLGVKEETLAREGAVSHSVAMEMALGIQSRLQTTWGVSITGIAGPEGGTSEKPVGLVYIGISDENQQARSFEFNFGSIQGREWVRRLSARTALDIVRRELLTTALKK